MIPRRLLSSQAAKKLIDPSKIATFTPATQNDFGKLMDLCQNGFAKAEPHSVALGLTGDMLTSVFEEIIGKSLHSNFSLLVAEKASGKLIGFRMMSVGHRDKSLDFHPEVNWDDIDPRVEILGGILDQMKSIFYDICDPSIEKVIRREVTFVDPKFQRMGIAQHLLHLNLDFDQLRKEKFDGLVSEASSIANQTLLKKNGYKFLAESDPSKHLYNGKPIAMGDGTQNMKLFFKDIRL